MKRYFLIGAEVCALLRQGIDTVTVAETIKHHNLFFRIIEFDPQIQDVTCLLNQVIVWDKPKYYELSAREHAELTSLL